jgi:hypothetical protein
MRTAMRRNEPSGTWPEEMANEINSDSSGIRCPFSAAPAGEGRLPRAMVKGMLGLRRAGDRDPLR